MGPFLFSAVAAVAAATAAAAAAADAYGPAVRIALRDDPAIEPFAYLANGSFSGPPVPLSPDPLVQFVWLPGLATAELQLYDVLPVSAALASGTSAASFPGLASLATAAPSVVVSGAGGFVVDFGVESAGWVEVDVLAASAPSPADLALVRMGLSEWTEPLQNKWRPPTAYARPASGLVTLRLETSAPGPQLYEGVRFAFFNLSAAPSRPFTLVALRCVAQAKQVSYVGAFAAAGGDDLLTRIWYTAAYSVRANLERDYFGAVLVNRGDRQSWTGDAHVAQAAAMTAFGNFAFVLENLRSSENNCNGIESYCILWCLSVVDYFRATNDTAAAAAFAPAVGAKLAHANAIFGDLTAQWEFYGWDDRLGSGFSNASTTESQWDYRFLSMRAFLAWADVLEEALGNATGAALFRGYAATGAAFVRAQLGGWTAPGVLGVHAAAEALNAPGFASPAEAAAVLANQLNDQGTICSQSNFNSYFILQGLGNAGALDKAVFKVERCWGVEVRLGATCLWEVSSPEWALFMRPGPSAAPWGENGNTSLCHPWSAGAAPWLTRNVLGISPLRPGFAEASVQPHITPEMIAAADAAAAQGEEDSPMLAGSTATPHGAVTLRVSRAHGVELTVPAGCAGGARLRLSEVLLHRLGWLDLLGTGRLEDVLVLVDGGAPIALRAAAEEARGPLFERELAAVGAARGAGRRSRVAELWLSAGAAHRVTLASSPLLPLRAAAGAAPAAAPAPFPPLTWSARIVQLDGATGGSWLSKYGAEGYFLFNFKGADLQRLPPFVASIGTMDAFSRAWAHPTPDADPRALQDPRNASSPRALGYLESGINQLPQYSFGVDIALTPAAEAAGQWFQAALFLVDYDLGFPTHTGAAEPRRLLVDVRRGYPALDPVAPTQFLGPELLAGGVWVVVQANSSIRLRVTCMPGATAVASAVAFDLVEAGSENPSFAV
jgi:alpha-L-rhamnosidase